MASKVLEKYDINSLLANIDFDQEGVDIAARKLPKQFLQAARFRVACMQRVRRSDAQLNEVRVSTAIAERSKAKQLATKKTDRITDTAIKEKVENSQPVRRSVEQLNDAIVMDELSKLILECYRMKKSAIQTVAEVTKSETALERTSVADMQRKSLINKKRKAMDLKYAATASSKTKGKKKAHPRKKKPKSSTKTSPAPAADADAIQPSS